MLKIILSATILIGVALPASAQGGKPSAAAQKQCEDKFKAADINNDGELNATEIGNAGRTLPTGLADKSRVTRAEFLSACAKTGT